MSRTPLRTAILGLDEKGLSLLECAAQGGVFKIEAVADKDAELAQKIAAGYDCRHYDDYRVAVMQSGIDVVFAAAPLHACAEYIHIALSKKLHVFRLAPPARTFEELGEFVHQAAQSRVQFGIAAPLRCNKAFMALREYLEQDRDENIFLVTAQCRQDQTQEPWQRDPKLAGGGILLYNCYEVMDQMVQSFGMPDEVYAVHTSQAPDRKQRLYVTEDTAVITMKFADTLTINIIASKAVKPDAHILVAYGRDKNIQVDGDKLLVADMENNILEEVNESAASHDLLSSVLTNFAQAIVAPEKNPSLSSGADHLATMALIESAYLSARTGVPESPMRILQISQTARYLAK